MATDLMIGMAHQPGTLAAACDALGRAGVNIEGAFGTVIDRSEEHTSELQSPY